MEAWPLNLPAPLLQDGGLEVKPLDHMLHLEVLLRFKDEERGAAAHGCVGGWSTAAHGCVEGGALQHMCSASKVSMVGG